MATTNDIKYDAVQMKHRIRNTAEPVITKHEEYGELLQGGPTDTFIVFATPFLQPPHITLTPVNSGAGSFSSDYGVGDITVTGMTIRRGYNGAAGGNQPLLWKAEEK